MPRRCTVCTSSRREEWDRLILLGTSYRVIARQSGTERLAHDAVQRHAQSHLPATMAKAVEQQALAHSRSLNEQARNLLAQAHDILERAKNSNQLQAANGAIGQAARLLELLMRASGELHEGARVQVNTTVALPVDPLTMEERETRLAEMFTRARQRMITAQAAEK